MKTLKSIFAVALLVLSVSVPVIAASGPKVIAVVNKADWCSVCKANGERATAVFMQNNKDSAIEFITNDLTNDTSEKKSSEELKKYGLDKVMTGYQGTGAVYFFNPETKELVNFISLAASDKELTAALLNAKKGLK